MTESPGERIVRRGRHELRRGWHFIRGAGRGIGLLGNTAIRRLALARWMRGDWDERARADARRFIACGHAESERSFWASGAWDLENLVLNDVRLRPEVEALEIGCGMGRLLRPLSERVRRVVGVDISPEMVARARAALTDRPNVEIQVTEGGLEPVGNASLDFVYSCIVFQHIPSRRAVARYFREAARVLRPGGVFRFQVDGRADAALREVNTWTGVRYGIHRLRHDLEECGLRALDVWGEGTHYLWVTARRPGDSSDDAPSAPLEVRTRGWNEETLADYLEGLQLPRSVAGRVLTGETSLRELAGAFLESHQTTDAAEFVRRTYCLVLGREADETGLEFYSREIRSGVARSNTLDCLIASPEAKTRFRRLDSL